jgi:hypothetical protein
MTAADMKRHGWCSCGASSVSPSSHPCSEQSLIPDPAATVAAGNCSGTCSAGHAHTQPGRLLDCNIRRCQQQQLMSWPMSWPGSSPTLLAAIQNAAFRSAWVLLLQRQPRILCCCRCQLPSWPGVQRSSHTAHGAGAAKGLRPAAAAASERSTPAVQLLCTVLQGCWCSWMLLLVSTLQAPVHPLIFYSPLLLLAMPQHFMSTGNRSRVSNTKHC